MVTLEQRFKTLLGEYAFTITALQHQIEELTKELETLRPKETNQMSEANV